MTAAISSSISPGQLSGDSQVKVKAPEDGDDGAKVARKAADDANQAQQEEIRKADLGPGAGSKIDITA